MRKIGAVAVLSVVLVAGLARPGGAIKNPSGSRQVTARQLMRAVESAHEDLMRAAKLSGALRNRRLWSSLDRMGRSIEEVGTALRSRDVRFFQSLERGSVALGELRVVQARSGVKAPEVDRGLGLLASSYRLLRSGYGSEQARYRRGGGLSESERQRFERIQAAQRDFAGHLEVLRRKAEERNDRAAVEELNRLIAEAYRIAAAPLTLDSYLNTLIAADEMRGEWAGNRAYAQPADTADWRAANAVVEELHVEAEVGHLFVMELGKVGDVSHLDEPAELPAGPDPESAAGAVQVFVPADEAAEAGEPVETVDETVQEGFVWDEPAVEEVPAEDAAGEEPAGEGGEVSVPEEPSLAEEETAVIEEEVIQEEDLPIEGAEPAPAASGDAKPEEGPPPPG